MFALACWLRYSIERTPSMGLLSRSTWLSAAATIVGMLLLPQRWQASS